MQALITRTTPYLNRGDIVTILEFTKRGRNGNDSTRIKEFCNGLYPFSHLRGDLLLLDVKKYLKLCGANIK